MKEKGPVNNMTIQMPLACEDGLSGFQFLWGDKRAFGVICHNVIFKLCADLSQIMRIQ